MDIQDAESLKCQERCAKKQYSWLVFLSECQLYMGAEDIVRKSLEIAASICVYTNDNISVEKL